MRVVVDDGVGLEVVTCGSGPGLLLVHGFGGAKEDFADHISALATDHQVVAFDHRGHGESDKSGDPGSYSLSRLADDVLSVADALGWPTFQVLGHSMGGMVAQSLVVRSPDRIDALVLMDTCPGVPPGIRSDLTAVAAEIAATRGMAELKRIMDEAGDPVSTPAHDRLLSERPGYREFNDRKFHAQDPAMYAALVCEISDRADELEALEGVECPTLVIVGEQDSMFLPGSHAMAEAIRGARLAVIPDAGHSPQFENPGVWLRVLQEFLSEVG